MHIPNTLRAGDAHDRFRALHEEHAADEVAMGGVFSSGDHSVARDASSAYSVTDAHTPLEDRDDVFDDRVAGSCSVLGYFNCVDRFPLSQ